MRKAPVTGEPVFPAKTPNTREIADIGDDQRGAQRIGLGYDQEFVGTDRSASGLELGTDAPNSTSAGTTSGRMSRSPDGLDLLKRARGAFRSATLAKLDRGDDADAEIVALDLNDLVEHSASRISNEIRDDIGREHVARTSHRSTAFKGSSVASRPSGN